MLVELLSILAQDWREGERTRVLSILLEMLSKNDECELAEREGFGLSVGF